MKWSEDTEHQDDRTQRTGILGQWSIPLLLPDPAWFHSGRTLGAGTRRVLHNQVEPPSSSVDPSVPY